MVARSEPKDVFKKFRVTPGCWFWEAEFFETGYGKLQYQGKTWQAHRLVYTLYNGEIPEGKILRHRCDVRGCVNPFHLETGTHQDNSDDMVSRGRHASGESHGRALVTITEVRQIRDLLNCRLFTQGVIANFYGVKRSLISDIHNNRCWSNYV